LGDVQVWPARLPFRRNLSLSLTGLDGAAHLELPPNRVAAFLRRTYAAVPRAMEPELIDWTAEFESLLGGAEARPESSPDI
jgi:hypothetical protein